MKADKSFIAYRYFLEPTSQISFFDDTNEMREMAIESFFSGLSENKKRNWEIGEIKYLLYYTRNISNNIFLCKFSRETNTTIHHELEDDIKESVEKDYPFVYLIVDRRRQIVLMELNTAVFASAEYGKDKLSRCFNEGFKLTGFTVMFEAISDITTFWNYVESATAIYEVSLTLNSPNLFGAFLKVNELLKAIRQDYQNTKTGIILSNEKGELSNINEENGKLADAIQYIAGGGGSWEVQVASSHKKKTRYKSANQGKKVILSRIHSSENIEEINNDIKSALDSVENVLKGNEGA